MPLSGVRVVDLTDERGIYGAKLLADLGADVVRPEPPEGDPLRQRGPWLQTSNDDQDATALLRYGMPSLRPTVASLKSTLTPKRAAISCSNCFCTPTSY